MTPEFFFSLLVLTNVMISVRANFHILNLFGGGSGESHEHGGSNNDESLTITISYESQITDTDDFFKVQLNAGFSKFSKCSKVVKWVFEPCEESHIGNDGKLTCPEGSELTCKLSRMQACVAEIHKNEENRVGLFVICVANAKNPTKSGPKCAEDAGIDWENIDQCIFSGQGDKYCDAFNKKIAPRKPKYIPSIMFDGKYVDCDDKKIKQDLTNTICEKLKKKHLQCEVCTYMDALLLGAASGAI